MRVSELAAEEDTLPRPKQRCFGNAPGKRLDAERRSALTGRSASETSSAGPLSGPGQRRCLLLRWCYNVCGTDRHDTEVIATVLLPAGFVVLGANRALLAIAHEVEAICCNSVVNEVPLGRSRTALAEGQVVLVGATLVSVTLDTDSHAGVSREIWKLLIECSCCIRSDRRLVEVEVDRASDRGRINHSRHWRNASRIRRQDI